MGGFGNDRYSGFIHRQSAPTSDPPRRGLKKGLYLLPSAFTVANVGMAIRNHGGAKGLSVLDGSSAEIERATMHFDTRRGPRVGVLVDALDGRIPG